MTNLIRSNFQAHPFHLVSPSPWPILTCVSLLALTTSGVLTMHGFSSAQDVFFMALLLVICSASFWFRDVISEATYLGNHTLAVQRGLNMGVALFIVSEGLFFLAIFWTFFHSALSPAVEMGAQWPPKGIDSVNPFELPLLNTILLLASGFTVTYAHHSVIQGNRSGALYGITLTVVLALAFTILQGVEYTVSSFTLSDSTFGSCFYFGTGLILGAPITFNTIHNADINVKPKHLLKYGNLEPYWITGFSDAESIFVVRIQKNMSRLLGIRILPIYSIELHIRDIDTLHKIKEFFNVGSVIVRIRDGKSTAIYSVKSIQDIVTVIIPHFKKFSLLTQKQADFILFQQAVNLIYNKKHLTEQGIHEILSIRASMGKGLTAKLITRFPNIIGIERPIVTNQSIKSPYWLAGFVDGEGCFYLKITKLQKIHLSFSISQHSRDSYLFDVIKNYLNCGIIENISTRPNGVTYVVYKLNDLVSKIIPILDNKLTTKKHLDFNYFKLTASLMLNEEHLTEQGIKKILQIKKLKKNKDTKV